MTLAVSTTRIAAALLAVSATATLIAQPRPPAPVPDVELVPERTIPAEQQAAAYKDAKWSAPKTSWGHPNLSGTWSTDDMRGIPRDRPPELGTQESLPEAQFIQRAKTQQAGLTSAQQRDTFLRNEWGTRTFGFTSLVVDPPDGRTPPLNDAGRARAEANRGVGTFAGGPFDAFDDFSLYDRCIGLGLNRGMGAAIYGNGIRIFQSPETVTITYEMIHETRVIRLADRPNIDLEQFTGNARGHWEGDTLVVESRGFTDRTSVGGGPHSKNLRTTERIRRVDPGMIEYRVTINDPDTYTAPFTVRTMWTTQPNYYSYEYSCHEGNFAVSGGLGGDRALEKQIAEAIAAGKEPPVRGTGRNIYGRPEEGAEVFDINAGE